MANYKKGKREKQSVQKIKEKEDQIDPGNEHRHTKPMNNEKDKHNTQG
jgi:recombination DNA repair RAD52 pathway protein